MRGPLIIVLAVLLFSSISCTTQTVTNPSGQKDSGTTTPTTSETARDNKVVTKSDTVLATKVRSKLATSKDTHIIRINVETDEAGVVVLTGTVPTAVARAQAEQMARSIDGVTRVVNNITIEGQSADAGGTRSKTSDGVEKSSDATIMTKINSRLITEGISGTNVAVNDGYVLLKGEVETAQQKANAEAIARKTDGVRGVTNQLTIKGISDKISDAAIMTKIKSQLVTEGINGVNVAVNDGYVLLKGEVNSPQEKATADAIARRTEGVKRVTNQLTIKRIG